MKKETFDKDEKNTSVKEDKTGENSGNKKNNPFSTGWSFPEGNKVNASSDEPLKFISSFSDIFISVSLAVFLFIGSKFVFDYVSGQNLFYNSLGLLFQLAVIIGFSEYITKHRKLSLPSIVLCIALLYVAIIFPVKIVDSFNFELDIVSFGTFYIFSPLIILLLYFLRYKLPFSVAPIFILSYALIWIIFLKLTNGVFDSKDLTSNFEYSYNGEKRLYLYFSFFLSLVFYSLAVLADLKDKGRNSYIGQMAFWAHFVAGPLLVQVVGIGNLLGESDIISVIIIILFIISSLLVNRRAGLFTGFLYLILILFYKETGTKFDQNLLFAVVTICLFLGLFWNNVRKILLSLPLLSKLKTYLPE